MSHKRIVRLALIAFLACLVSGVWAQDSAQQKPTEPSNSSSAASGSSDPNGGVGEILAQATERAASRSETWGHKLGIGPDTSFAISVGFNFAVIAFLFYLLVKSKLLQAFRDRTAAIQSGIREAKAATAEASRRLADIEARLARIDKEVGEIRTSSEQDAAAEEQRIRTAAEEDKRKVVQAAETEITAIARNARQELKTYAASLAVDLAGQQIRVDDSADQALVRDFVDQFGREGK